ncbi:hypothetical protein [Merismopedia glauca]|uniref:hypothetical protein n=1 Tax=Merismopedia glauca TaxID=292586 RepID=UPI0026C65E3C
MEHNLYNQQPVSLTQVSTSIANYQHDFQTPEQQVYDHLLFCVHSESPQQLMERFRLLFLSNAAYPHEQVNAALEKIIFSRQAEAEFPLFLNRCCYILVNYWQMKPETQAAVPYLVKTLENTPTTNNVYARKHKRLLQLVKLFILTPQFNKLQCLAELITTPPERQQQPVSQEPLKRFIRRYPYLYQYYLLADDSSYEQQQAVRKMQARTQEKFEIQLSQYVTYQMRLGQLTRQGVSASQAQRLIHPVNNPTLLSEKELGKAIAHFTGKIDGVYTYQEVAHRFQAYSAHLPAYKNFKDSLYQYLISTINTSYGERHFNQRLYQHLQNILPDCDRNKVDEFILVRTCNQLLNFLIVDSPQNLNHFVFIDLISNLGSPKTIGLILKILLLCRKVKPQLEKRLTILFNHYESSSTEGLPWLITSLENLNVAYSLHFGKTDVSCLKQLK